MSLKNRLTLILVAVVVVIALAITGGIIWYNSTNYVATVNGEKITKTEYTYFLTGVKANLETNLLNEGALKTGDEAELKKYWQTEDKIDNKKPQDWLRDKAIEAAEEYKMELIKAKEANTVLKSEDWKKMETQINDYVKNEFGVGVKGKNAFEDKYGVTVTEFKAIYKNQLLINTYWQALDKKNNTVTDADIQKYYDDHKKDYEMVTVRHILFNTTETTETGETKDLPKEKQQEAKKKADETLAKVNEGEDMKALADKLSEDPGVKENHGEYTYKKDDALVEEFKKFGFDNKEGATGIVKTSYGYHVMKVEKKGEYSPLDKEKETIKETIHTQKFNDMFTSMLAKWKKEFKINRKTDVLTSEAAKVLNK